MTVTDPASPRPELSGSGRGGASIRCEPTCQGDRHTAASPPDRRRPRAHGGKNSSTGPSPATAQPKMRRRSRARAARGSSRGRTCVAGARRLARTSESIRAIRPSSVSRPVPVATAVARVDDGGAEVKEFRRSPTGQVGIWKRLRGFLHGGIPGQGGFVGAQGMVLTGGVGPGRGPPFSRRTSSGNEPPGRGSPGSPRPAHFTTGAARARQRRHRLFGSVTPDEAEHAFRRTMAAIATVSTRSPSSAETTAAARRPRPSWRRTGRKDPAGANGGPSGSSWAARAKTGRGLGAGQPGPGVGTKLPNDVRIPAMPVAMVRVLYVAKASRKQTMGNNGKGLRRSPFAIGFAVRLA